MCKANALLVVMLLIISPVLFAQVIKNDFRVNDDTTGCSNSSPAVAITAGGEAIVVWQDGRNGNSNTYGQAYDASGNSVGANFKVSTLSAQEYEFQPAISSYGDSLLVISEYGRGQWLLSSGSQSGSAFFLRTMYMPSVAVGASGFFITWHDYSGAGGQEIFVQWFDLNGDSLNNRMLVNDDGTSYEQYRPKIAMADDGDFVVVWQDFRNGNDHDIYGQLFNSSGNKIGTNFLINDNSGTTSQYQPVCAMDSAGNFVVVWYDYRNGNSKIFGQRFAPDGDTTGLGGNFQINDDPGDAYHYMPSCAMDNDGNLVVVWYDSRNGNSDLYCQLYDDTGTPQGTNFRIDQCPGNENQNSPVVSMNESNFIVTWWDVRSEVSIYKRSFYNNGTPVGNEVKVNDVDGTLHQYAPAIDMNSSGNTVVTWWDYRNPGGIYFQRFTALGQPIGNNAFVYPGYDPEVAVGKGGSYVITHVYYGNDIYCTMFDNNGNQVGPHFQVNDTSNVNAWGAAIDMDTLGKFIITWCDYRNGNSDVYVQRFDSSGNAIGVNFKVNDDVGTFEQYQATVAYSSSGQFLIAWRDLRNGNDYDIFGQLYDANGNPVNTNFRIDNDPGTNGQFSPSAVPLADGNFVVVWEDYRTPLAIYGQVIDPTGSLVGTNFQVSDDGGAYPAVAVAPSGSFVVTWYDFLDGNADINAQRYNPDYSPDNINYKVNNAIEGLNPEQLYPDVATNGTNIIFTWQDTKWQRGWDIAAKVVDWNFTKIEEDKGNCVLLMKSVPNPFVNFTMFHYEVRKTQNVRIDIYDLSGRLIKTLLDDRVEVGVHTLRWDAKDAINRRVPAGVYFCKLKTETDNQLKKLVLLR